MYAKSCEDVFIKIIHELTYISTALDMYELYLGIRDPLFNSSFTNPTINGSTMYVCMYVDLSVVVWSIINPSIRALHMVRMGAHSVYMGAQCRPNGRP